MLLSWSCRLCGVLALRLLFVYREGCWYTSPCCLIIPPCQMDSFFFLGLDSKPNISDPWSRVTAFSPVSWWWLYCVLLGSEIIPAGLYFCTEPCKGSLEQNFQGPWPIPLLGSEGGISSDCAWAISHQQEMWISLCLASLWTEWRGDIPPLQTDKALYWLWGDWNEVWIWLQLQSVLKTSISFCSISTWLIPASSFPAVTTVYTRFQRRTEMGWKCSLPLTLLSPWGQLDISVFTFGTQTEETLPFLVGCVDGIYHEEMPVQHMPLTLQSKG